MHWLSTGWLAGSAVAVFDLWHCSCRGAICHCRCMWLELRAHRHPWATKVLYSFAFVPVFSEWCQKATIGWVLLRSPLAAGLWLMFDWPRCAFRWGPLALGGSIKSHNHLYIFLFKNPQNNVWHPKCKLCDTPTLVFQTEATHGKK